MLKKLGMELTLNRTTIKNKMSVVESFCGFFFFFFLVNIGGCNLVMKIPIAKYHFNEYLKHDRFFLNKETRLKYLKIISV